jgi:hypothetical protein
MRGISKITKGSGNGKWAEIPQHVSYRDMSGFQDSPSFLSSVFLPWKQGIYVSVKLTGRLP